MRIPRHRKSSLLFGLSAAGPIGVWLIFLFAAVPARQRSLEHAGSLISYAFSEFESSWFFVVLTLVPALLLVLALAQWVRSPEGGAKSNWVKWGGALATLASLVVCWPVAITAAQATYYAFRPSVA